MGRLSAVACLSLAAKVEETYVPLLLDLQLAVAEAEVEAGYVFEAKTVRRMELLALLLAALPALLLAALLLSFRSALLAGNIRLASIADRDPAVRSLLSRLSSAAAGPPPRPPPRRRPFLHLTRVGTLDEDFFSDSVAGDRRTSLRPAASSNVSFPLVRLFRVDSSLRFPRSPISITGEVCFGVVFKDNSVVSREKKDGDQKVRTP